MPNLIGLDLNEPMFPDDTLYHLRQVYQPKDATKIMELKSEYKSKWNERHGSRFTIAETIEVTSDFITIKGYAKTSESFNQLNMDSFWAQHEHIEGVVDYDAYFYEVTGGGGTQDPPPGSDPGSTTLPPPTQEPGFFENLDLTKILIIAGLVVGGFMLFRMIRRKK